MPEESIGMTACVRVDYKSSPAPLALAGGGSNYLFLIFSSGRIKIPTKYIYLSPFKTK